MNPNEALEVAMLAASVGGTLNQMDKRTELHDPTFRANKIDIHKYTNLVKNVASGGNPQEIPTSPTQITEEEKRLLNLLNREAASTYPEPQQTYIPNTPELERIIDAPPIPNVGITTPPIQNTPNLLKTSLSEKDTKTFLHDINTIARSLKTLVKIVGKIEKNTQK
jgi:hypothetical protein